MDSEVVVSLKVSTVVLIGVLTHSPSKASRLGDERLMYLLIMRTLERRSCVPKYECITGELIPLFFHHLGCSPTPSVSAN